MVTIRKVLPSDNKILAQLIRSVFEEFDAPKTGTVYSDPTTDQLFEFFENTEKSSLFVIEKDGNVMGCCGVYPTNGLQKGYAELVKFYLKPEARGKGIGKTIFEKTINEAKEFGYSHLYIESQPSFNKAVKMYEIYDFKYINEPLGNSGHSNCDIWMLKNLTTYSN